MVRDEAMLLQRFVASGDAKAFSEIVRRYASLVYSACVRILGDKETAADATQETFFQFLRNANTITGSVPAWLHRVATCKAVDRIRAESSRRRAEAFYADAKCREIEKWEDLSPVVDQALEALDAPSRELLIEYFFEGRTLTDIADERGISHPTVSRHVKAAVNKLRGQLRRSGAAVSAVALSSLLTESTAQAAPSALLAELAKMALAGGAELTVAGGLLVAAKAKLIVVATVVGVATVGVFTYKHLAGPNSSPELKSPVTSNTRQDDVVPPTSAPVSVPQAAIVAEKIPAPESWQEVADAEQSAVDSAPQPEQQSPSQEVSQDNSPRLDLTTPEATVRSFTRLMAAGDAEAVIACFLPGGIDYQDMQEILAADPADPRQQSKFEMRQWLQSFDPDAEMPILEMNEKADGGLSIAWQVTFKRDFAMDGHTFMAGQTMTLDADLARADDGRWLINGI